MLEFYKMMDRINKAPVEDMENLFETEGTFQYFQTKFLSTCVKYIIATRTFHN